MRQKTSFHKTRHLVEWQNSEWRREGREKREGVGGAWGLCGWSHEKANNQPTKRHKKLILRSRYNRFEGDEWFIPSFEVGIEFSLLTLSRQQEERNVLEYNWNRHKTQADTLESASLLRNEKYESKSRFVEGMKNRGTWHDFDAKRWSESMEERPPYLILEVSFYGLTMRMERDEWEREETERWKTKRKRSRRKITETMVEDKYCLDRDLDWNKEEYDYGRYRSTIVAMATQRLR